MEGLLLWITQYAEFAHFVLFGLLILAGFNVPVSEDVVLIVGGVLASTVVPENTLVLFLWIFSGALISDWIAYGIGRYLGPQMGRSRWLRKVASPERVEKVASFYERYGMRTLLIGRFIPFGVRNCLFMVAGVGRMHFGKFVLADGAACLASNLLLFSLAYNFGKNYHELYAWVMTLNWVLFAAFCLGVSCLLFVWLWRTQELEKPSV